MMTLTIVTLRDFPFHTVMYVYRFLNIFASNFIFGKIADVNGRYNWKKEKRKMYVYTTI